MVRGYEGGRESERLLGERVKKRLQIGERVARGERVGRGGRGLSQA